MPIQIQTGFYRPFAIEKDSKGRFFVANFITYPSVGIFSPEFKLIGWLTETNPSSILPSAEESLFAGPHSICLDQFENIFVNDYLVKKVFKFNSDGKFISVALTHQSTYPKWVLSGPASTYFDGDGNYIVSDYGSHSIQKFSASGAFLGWIGMNETNKRSEQWQISGRPISTNTLGITAFDQPGVERGKQIARELLKKY